jgi:GNAT superfamily N-acetyltransferase
MTSDLVYRTATPADAGIIFDLVCELAVYEKLSDEVLSTPQDFENLLKSKDRFFCYLAEQNGAPVGFCMGFYTLSTFLGKPGIYIEDLYVKESCRGLGIGKSFFKMVAQKALDEGCGRIEWSVLDWNEPSIKFYESLGAKPLSEWIKYRLDSETIKQVAGQ